MDVQVLNLAQADRWLEVLDMCNQHDFYHCPSYHEISIQNTSYDANLYVYQEGDYTKALPIVIRPVNEVEGLESFSCYDATSVYGYAGPIASHRTIPERIIENFQGSLNEYLKDTNIVCVFSRLHPLINQEYLLTGFGDAVFMGQTVSIDLRLLIDVQYSHYRNNHKRDLRKLKDLGVYCRNEQNAEHLTDFVDIYHENMKSANAREEYFFDSAYFQKLISAKDFDMRLFTCFLDDEIICSGLFSLCNGIVQAHLMATRSKYIKLAAMKLLIDEVRIWANEVGALCFHLGGGRGAEEDSLLRFKAGFSDTVHTFNVWQLVVMKREYMEICKKKAIYDECRNRTTMKDNYFPSYRGPAT